MFALSQSERLQSVCSVVHKRDGQKSRHVCVTFAQQSELCVCFQACVANAVLIQCCVSLHTFFLISCFPQPWSSSRAHSSLSTHPAASSVTKTRPLMWNLQKLQNMNNVSASFYPSYFVLFFILSSMSLHTHAVVLLLFLLLVRVPTAHSAEASDFLYSSIRA